MKLKPGNGECKTDMVIKENESSGVCLKFENTRASEKYIILAI